MWVSRRGKRYPPGEREAAAFQVPPMSTRGRGPCSQRHVFVRSPLGRQACARLCERARFAVAPGRKARAVSQSVCVPTRKEGKQRRGAPHGQARAVERGQRLIQQPIYSASAADRTARHRSFRHQSLEDEPAAVVPTAVHPPGPAGGVRPEQRGSRLIEFQPLPCLRCGSVLAGVEGGEERSRAGFPLRRRNALPRNLVLIYLLYLNPPAISLGGL